MDYPSELQNGVGGLQVDNPKIQAEIQSLIDRGRTQFNLGTSIQEKKQGIMQIFQGIKKLELWMNGVQDNTILTSLKEQYNNLHTEIEEKLATLQSLKKNEDQSLMINLSDHGGDGSAVGGATGGVSGSGAGDNKDEISRLKSALEEAIVTEKPNIKWTDVAGLIKAKESLQEVVILPIRFSNFFQGAHMKRKGILLYGPPGTGKTYLAKACANEIEGTFFSISSSDFVSKFIGEPEKLIKDLFALAREKKPSILFIDEIDNFCGNRSDCDLSVCRRVKTEFLVQMQGVRNDDGEVQVLGATNAPWDLDPAIRRRFEKRIYIPLPDAPARKFLLQNNMFKTPHELQEYDFSQLADRTDGFSGAEISILVRDAIFEPVRKLQSAKKFKINQANGKYMPVEDSALGPDIQVLNSMDLKQIQLELPPISRADFDVSIKKSKRFGVEKNLLKQYEDWTQEFGSDG